MFAGADVGGGVSITGADVAVGDVAVEVNVSVDMAVLVGIVVFVGSKVGAGFDVSVGAEGWKGVAVAVEFGLTVTRLKSGICGVGAILAGAQEARAQIKRIKKTRGDFVIDTNS